MTNQEQKRYDRIVKRLGEVEKAENARLLFHNVVNETKSKLEITLKFNEDFNKAKNEKIRLDFKAAGRRLEELKNELRDGIKLMEEYVKVEENIRNVRNENNEYFSSLQGQEDLFFYRNKQDEILKNQAKAIKELNDRERAAPIARGFKAPKGFN